jgi:hypothetical protein
MTNLRRRLRKIESGTSNDASGYGLYSPGWYRHWTERIHRVFIDKTEPAECGCITIEAFRAILVARAEQIDSDDSEART